MGASPSPSSTVAMIVRATARPNPDRKNLRGAAEGILAGNPEPIDTVWLRIAIGRTYTDKHRDEAIAAYELAYELAKQHGFNGARADSGLALYRLYSAVGRKLDASRVLHETGRLATDLAQDQVDRAIIGAATGFGRLVTTAGTGLRNFGQRVLDEVAEVTEEVKKDKGEDRPAK